MTTRTLARVVALACFASAGLALACSGAKPTSPSGSSQLHVNGIFPTNGSTVGTVATIVGGNFTADAVVRVDGVVTPADVTSVATIVLTMPAHAPGLVDVTVTKASETATVPKGFTYVFVVPLAPPVISTITPNAGAPQGFNLIQINGTGFQPGATVTIGGFRPDFVFPNYFGLTRSATLLPVFAPEHAAGLVDVVVTNPDGQQSRVPDGYRYQTTESFDFNGVWTGFAWEVNFPISFTIQDNALVSVSCGTVLNHTFTPAPVVSGGKFSVKNSDGSMEGELLSASEATGLIDFPGCPAYWGWQARK